MAYMNGRYHEVEAWNGESSVLPPGTDYVFQIEAVEQKPSSQKGTLQLVVTCVVQTGEHQGRKAIFRYNLTESQASRARVKALIVACGVQLNQDGGCDDSAFVGRLFMADVSNEPYKKTDPNTGMEVERMSARCLNERPYGQAAQPSFAPQPMQAQAPQPMQQPMQQMQAPQPQMYSPPPANAPVGAPVGRPAYPPPPAGRGAPAGLTTVR